jgi:hypothetical protein
MTALPLTMLSAVAFFASGGSSACATASCPRVRGQGTWTGELVGVESEREARSHGHDSVFVIDGGDDDGDRGERDVDPTARGVVLPGTCLRGTGACVNLAFPDAVYAVSLRIPQNAGAFSLDQLGATIASREDVTALVGSAVVQQASLPCGDGACAVLVADVDVVRPQPIPANATVYGHAHIDYREHVETTCGGPGGAEPGGL